MKKDTLFTATLENLKKLDKISLLIIKNNTEALKLRQEMSQQKESIEEESQGKETA